jgi:uncharacterized delta-60 repeat protein
MAAPQLVSTLAFDPAFGGGDGFSNPYGFHAFALQPDGEFVGIVSNNSPAYAFPGFVLGFVPMQGSFIVGRLNSDGSLDTSFGAGGSVTTEVIDASVWGNTSYPTGFALQPDGKLIAAGTVQFGIHPQIVVVRYSADGTLDTNFGVGGKVYIDPAFYGGVANSVALQADGKIVLAGYGWVTGAPGTTRDLAVVRLNSDGTLDSTFSGDGIARVDISGYEGLEKVVIQPDGKILVAGSTENFSPHFLPQPVFVRYNADGSLDTSFDADGILTMLLPTEESIGAGTIKELVVQPDGKILAEGLNNLEIAVFRLNADGSFDSTFNTIHEHDLYPGFTGTNALAVQADGRILLAGGSYPYSPGIGALKRFNADGTPDLSLSAVHEILFTSGSPTDILLAPDGSVFVTTEYGVAKLIDGPISALVGQTAVLGQSFTFAFGSQFFFDPDGDSLAFSASIAGGGALPAWLAFDGSSVAFNGIAAPADLGTFNIEVHATDPGGQSVSLTFLLTVKSATAGSNANDFIIGTPNDDFMLLLLGDDVADGGLGSDTLIGGLGADSLQGGGDGDQLQGYEGADTVRGGFGADAIGGNTENDLVRGSVGNDNVGGGKGNDVVGGGQGNDVIRGGLGNDDLTGGFGADRFVFAAAGTADSDLVHGFAAVDGDTIELNSIFFATLTSGPLDSAQFQLLILYDAGSGALSYDADGDGSGALLIATFAGAPAIAATDIFVV